MPEIKIRLATTEDADIIAELSRTTFYDSFAVQNTKEDMDKFMTEQFTLENLKDEVSDSKNTFFLAYADDMVAGYLKMREAIKPSQLNGIDAIEIARIYAQRDFIGKGLGGALMQKAIDTAIEKFKTVIWLGVWEFNQQAIDFYTKWGFKKFGIHNFRLGNDIQKDWLMKKELYN